MFTKSVGQNEVAHSIDDSLLLLLNKNNFISSHFQEAIQKVEHLAEQLSVTVVSFEFFVGDIDKMNEIFDCLKLNQSDEEKRIGRDISPTSLFIAGTYLEDQISICILNALAIGYDVYLLTDVTVPHDTVHREIFLARLTQAGAVLSTFHQMLYQWLVVETDSNRKDMLGKLLDIQNLLQI